MPHGRGPPLPLLGVGSLGLVQALGKDLSILVGSILGSLRAAALECDPVALVLETLRSNQTLDLGSLGVWPGALLLGLNLTADDKLADIIFLAEAEEAADLGSTLGTKALGVNDVGKTGNVVVALLDDAQSKDGKVHADDATTNGLPLALASAARAVARVTVSEEESDTGRVHDTLLHGKALLVVAAGDSEDVALELITDAVARNLLSHTAFHEDTELALVFDLDQLLGAIVGVGNVELHLDGGVEMTVLCCNVSRLS